MQPSTVNRVLRREGLPPLNEVDLATRRELRGPVVRYERDRPGELVHVDIKKLGKIPDGGGHHTHGRAVGKLHSRLTTRLRKGSHPVIGYGYVHTALDDHSRLAYSEVLQDETAASTAAWWERAIAWFALRGITIERVLTDNGPLLPLDAVGRCLPTSRHHPETHPRLPPTDQRQGRALPPDIARRMGLHPPLQLREVTHRRLAQMAAHLQPSPHPHRARRPPTSEPRDQPVRSVQLAANAEPALSAPPTRFPAASAAFTYSSSAVSTPSRKPRA
jgi:hypothetical protein